MGEARRRKLNGMNGQGNGIKITPRKREDGFLLVHHNRVERQNGEGVVYAQNVFRVVDADGKTVVEETPDGPKPVLLLSVPQPVRRDLIVAPKLLHA